jgi:hypothetical protein
MPQKNISAGCRLSTPEQHYFTVSRVLTSGLRGGVLWNVTWLTRVVVILIFAVTLS